MSRLAPSLALVVVLATLGPFVPSDHWFFAGLAFPRPHLIALAMIVCVAGTLAWAHAGLLSRSLTVLTALAAVHHALWVLPYTPLWQHEVRDVVDARAESSVAVLIANVFMENREGAAFLKLVEEVDPDILVTLESDEWWARELAALEDRWPHVVDASLSNTYGMMLHSRLEFREARVEYLVWDDVPSLFTTLTLADGDVVELIAVHPRPPVPGETSSPAARDAELLQVAQRVTGSERPTIVVGDLNAVAWSPVTKLFQRISGTLDPRIGRGFFGTWNATWPGLEFPLDHVFHTDHFGVSALRTHRVEGSDHRAVSIVATLSSEARHEQDEPRADAGDVEDARETIAEGLEASDR